MFDIPFIDLPPLRGVSGTVRLPGSKSISNRMLLLAGLASGRTTIQGLLAADDTAVMLSALRALGCGVDEEGTAWHIGGLGGRLKTHTADLFLGNAGTAMRPLTAVLAVMAATQGGSFDLAGVPRMHERPIGDLVDALQALGCTVQTTGRPGYPPLRVSGSAGGTLDVHAPIRIRGDVSSQFLSALLMALPLAGAPRAVVVEVDGELISRPYIDLTLRLMARFGVVVEQQAWERFSVPAGTAYTSPGVVHVEGDASSASYFIAAGAIAAAGGAPLRIDGVGLDSIQGDIAFVDAARAMGALVRGGAGWLEVRRGRWPLAGITLDCTAIPDAAMTLAAMALYADAPTRLTGIASWRVKETDRIAAMAAELRAVGATVVAHDDAIEITPPAGPAGWRAATVHTHDDHRMAMCLALAAFNPLAGATPPRPVRLLDPRCVGKTFPDYFEALFGVAQADAAEVPVLAVDGPTASGKGTLAAAVAGALGYHLLDSGALYRAAGLAAFHDGVALDDESAVAHIASALELVFGQGGDSGRVWLRGREITLDLRQEATGQMASRVSALPAVRRALHGLQLSFRRPPGLVADGRDMGTVVFPDARLKVYLTANAEQRAERRHRQLLSKGLQANISALRADLQMRDARDRGRSVAPLVAAEDALTHDNSHLDIDASVEQVLAWWQQRSPFN